MARAGAASELQLGVKGGVPALTGLIFAGMGAGTFTIVSLGILASFIIDDLGITRAQLGLVIGADTLIAAAFSPYAGRIADRLGGRRSLIALFLMAATAWFVYSRAPVYGLMFAGAVFGGMADASCNPATNRMIVERLPLGRRGVITGIKQSGVQAGVFIGGVTLPSLAVAFGWRTTYVLVAALPVVLAILASVLVAPANPAPAAAAARKSGDPLPPSIRWLAAYGLLFGFAGAASLLVPLYVEEALGRDARLGGLVAGIVGLVAVGARIWWARYSERIGKFIEPLWMMTPLGVAGALAFLLADDVGLWLVWPAAALLGMSTSSWNGVAMLAAMTEGGDAATGRASGIIVGGFLLGLGLGPPIYGALVDRSDSYDPMWLLSGAAALATGLLVAVWQVQRRRSGARTAKP